MGVNRLVLPFKVYREGKTDGGNDEGNRQYRKHQYTPTETTCTSPPYMSILPSLEVIVSGSIVNHLGIIVNHGNSTESLECEIVVNLKSEPLLSLVGRR